MDEGLAATVLADAGAACAAGLAAGDATGDAAAAGLAAGDAAGEAAAAGDAAAAGEAAAGFGASVGFGAVVGAAAGALLHAAARTPIVPVASNSQRRRLRRGDAGLPSNGVVTGLPPRWSMSETRTKGDGLAAGMDL